MKEKTIIISVLNIIMMEPHSPERYYQLFKSACHQYVPYHGDHHGGIGEMTGIDFSQEISNKSEARGSIHTFTRIDMDDPWFNRNQGKQAEPKEIGDIQIPQYLEPGLGSYHYLFFPFQHRFFFDTTTEIGKKKKTLGPKRMRTLIENVLNQEYLRKMYGEISVVVEPVEDALDKIFRMAHLRKLEIQINRPNSDPLYEYEEKFEARLKNQHAGKMRQELTAKPNESLVPDDETRLLAKLAQSNGYVRGSGRDQDGKPSEENTKEPPQKNLWVVSGTGRSASA
uniref:Uncharacterized protein n=1 Tax=Candidatus Kentrum sp. TC TaxID=2126339 RepID=A0A451A898_9GAMM|nr:MAG: protein of unknown function (DUF4747) [Candidatus Kentron sp. TC]